MKFPLGDVLSVTTGKLVGEKGIIGVAELIEFLAGQPVPLIFRDTVLVECRQHVLSLYPPLNSVDPSEVSRNNWRDWLVEKKAELGNEVEISPLALELQELLRTMIDELPPEAKLQFIKDGGINR